MTHEIKDYIKLTINWTAFLKDSLVPPKIGDEAVIRLISVLDDENRPLLLCRKII